MLSCFGGVPKQKESCGAKQKAKPRKPPPGAPPADLSGQPHAAPAHSPLASKLATQPSLGSRESPSLLAPPTPPLTGIASTPSSAPTNALPAPTDPPPSLEHGLESKLLKATPWSTAVLTSDAKEVLLHRRGHEPAAALILDQALQLQNPMGPSSTPFATASGAPVDSPAPQSFLHTLLGPYLEAQALATLETGRPWRTNVTKHLACGDLLSSPGVLGSSASCKNPSAELGGTSSEGNPRAHRSWSVGAGHISPVGAEQADSASAGHCNIGRAGQSDPVGAVQGKEHRVFDDLAAAEAGPEEPRGWLSSGGSVTSGATADVNAFVSGIPASNKATHAGVAVTPFGAVTPFAAAAEEAAPEHPRPVSDPNQHPRDPILNGMANGRHPGMEDSSLGRMRTSISACDNCFQGSSHDQKPQHRSSAALTLSRSNSASNDSVSSRASFYTADPAAWEDEGCDHWDWEDRGLPAVEGREPQAWAYGSLGLSSKATLDSRHSLECIAMDRQRSEDVGLLIGDIGENWRDQVAGQWGAAGTGAPALVPSSSWKRRPAKSSRTQLGNAAELRGRSAELPGQGPALGGAKSVPSASLARRSNPPRHKSQQLRGSLSCRNIRQEYLQMSDKALGQLRERSKTDDSTSKTLALLTSISQAQVPAATESKRRGSLYSRHSQSSPSQLSRRASQLHPPSSPGGSSPSCQIISFANAAFHEPNATAYTDQSGESEGVTFQPTCSASNDVHTSLSHAVQSLSNPQLEFSKKQRNSRGSSQGHISAPSPAVRAPTSTKWRESQHVCTPYTEGTLSEAPKKAGQEGTVLHKPQGSKPSALKSVLSQPAPSVLSQGVLKELVEMSFDIVVSPLESPEAGLAHKTCPLVVTVYNTTEHTQLLSTLSALAESQLELLSSIMPQHAIQFLAMESTEAVPSNVAQLARKHRGITLLFMDIVGFTTFAKEVEPVEVMMLLNTLFSLFDELVDQFGVQKVETAGDCYIVSGGIMSPSNQADGGLGLVLEDHDHVESATRVMEFAKAMLEVAQQVKLPKTEERVRVRVGMHTGDVVSGLIGSKLPKFSIFGDTMNTASRMESTGAAGRIHVSETTHKLLHHKERWQSTGGVEVKGKGLMNTYLWVPTSDSPTVSQRLSPPSSDSLQAMRLKHTCKVLEDIRPSLGQVAASCPLPLLKHPPSIPPF